MRVDASAPIRSSATSQPCAASIQPRKPMAVVTTTTSGGLPTSSVVTRCNSMSSTSGMIWIAGACTTAGADRNTQIGLHEGGRVVDAIAHHRDHPALVLEPANLGDLVFGQHLGQHCLVVAYSTAPMADQRDINGGNPNSTSLGGRMLTGSRQVTSIPALRALCISAASANADPGVCCVLFTVRSDSPLFESAGRVVCSSATRAGTRTRSNVSPRICRICS